MKLLFLSIFLAIAPIFFTTLAAQAQSTKHPSPELSDDDTSSDQSNMEESTTELNKQAEQSTPPQAHPLPMSHDPRNIHSYGYCPPCGRG